MAGLKRFSAGIVLAIFVGVFGYILVQSTRLRPIADDYCLGASAVDGPFHSLIFWLTNWSGSPFSVLTQVLFASWPLAALPIGISSSISFVAAGLAVGLVTAYLLQARWANAPFKTSLLVISVTTGWFVSFRVGQVLELRAGDDPIGNRSWIVAEILAHWQTVNSGYVAASSLAMLLLGWSFLSPYLESHRSRYIAIGLASLVVGWTSYVFAASVAGAFLLVSFSIRLREASVLTRRLEFSAVGILSGVATSFLFPGARARTDANVGSSIDVLLEGLRNTPSGLGEWVSDVASAPTFFAFLLGVVVASLGVAKRPSELSSPPQWVSGFLLLASLLTYILNELVAALIYGGLWHTVPGRLMIFMAALLMGVSLVRLIQSRDSITTEVATVFSVLQTLIVVGVLALTVVGAVVLRASIDSRQVVWEQGPAEIRGLTFMDDREAEWVGECWRDIEGARQESQ